jgi:hypothetical protein
MSRGSLSFKQTDVTRAIKALVAAGVGVARVEIDKDGKITVVPSKSAETADLGASERNDWDVA